MQTIKDSVIGIFLSGKNNYTKIGTLNVYNNSKNVDPKEKLEGQDYFLPHLEKSFTGRNEELTKLNSLFFKENKRKVAICGLPAYGKSELAKNFAVNCKQEGKVSNIIWINAETRQDLQIHFEKLAKILKIKCNEQLIKSVYDCFKENTIIVFDNVPDRNTVRDYEPKSDNIYCIFTCQNNSWIYEVEILKIKELSPEAALQILKCYLGNDYNETDSNKYKRLSKYFGNYPLVLQIVGSFIKREIQVKDINFNLDTYIQELQQSENILDECTEKSKLCNSSILYKKSINEAIKKSLDKIGKDNKLALNILYVTSFLNGEHIFYNVLFGMQIISKLLINSKNKKEKLEEALKLLVEYSFIKVDFPKQQIKMHNFIQELIRHRLSKCNNQIINKTYGACVKLISSNNNYIHIPSIIKNADRLNHYTTIFSEFYIANAEYINIKKYIKFKDWMYRCTGLQLILESLIEGRCKNSLKIVLQHLGYNKSRKFINEYNLLHEAVNVGDHKILALLLNHKPKINKKDKDGHDALHAAAFKWDEEIIKTLLAYKAKLNTIDQNNNTVLHNFVQGAINIEDQTIDTNKAIRIINLLKGNKIINEIKNRSGESLLHIAVSSFRPELIKLFIDKYYINPDDLDLDNCTPLHELVFRAKKVDKDNVSLQDRIIKSAETLLTYNASLNICNNKQETPLETAIRFKVEFLINVLNNKGTCSIMIYFRVIFLAIILYSSYTYN